MMDNLMNDDDLVEIFSNNTSPKQKTEQNSPCISTVEKRVMIGKSQVFSKDSTCQGKSEYQEETMLSEPDIDDCNNLLNYNKQIISSLLDLRKQITYALKQCEKKLTVIDSNLERYVTGDTRALICNAGMPYFKDRNHFFAPNNDDEILKEHRKELQLRNLPKVIAWTSKERNDLLVAIQTEVKTVPNKIYNVKLDESTRKPHWELNKNGKIKKKLLAINQENLIVPLNEASLDWFKIASVYLDDLYSPFDCRIMWEVFLHPRNNKLSWTKSEDAELKEITKNYKFQNWDKIAIELDTNRSAYQCFIRYNTIRKFPKTKNCIWLRSEDNRLLKLVKIFKIGDFIPWGEVATWMKGRTKQQVYFRWNYSLAPHLIKGRFSQLEDNLLKDAVSKCGTNFAKISAALMPHRSTIQLHDRYQTLTNSKVENWNVWSLEEDLKLSRLFDRFGPNWSKISSIITCKTRTQLRHRHNSIEKYLNKGRSIYDLHPDHSVNVLDPEKQNEKLDQLLHNCKNDFDKELLKYFHKEIKTEISLDRKPFYGSVTSESNTRSLYDILQELNAELRITDDAINNSLLHSRHKQLLYSLKDYIDMRNNKRRHCMPKINYESPNETKCIDYHEDTKKTFLDEPTMVIDTPDVVISHIGGWEQELEFKKLARLLVQNNSLGNKRFTNSDTNIENSSNRKKLRFAESGKVISTVRLKDSKGNDNALFKRSDDRSSINLSTSQSKDAMINTTSASTAKSSEDQSVPAIETTHATLLSLQRLLRLKSFNEKYNDSPKFLRISNRCQRSFSLLETRLEKLFKYPIGLSKIPLPDVYVIDSSPCNDVRSKKRNSKSTEIKTSYKIKKL